MTQTNPRPVYSEKGGEFVARRVGSAWQVIWMKRELREDHVLCDTLVEAQAVAIADAMNRQRS